MPVDSEIGAGATCWQCGAPADPDCTYIRTLSRRSRPLADGHGYPVVHGRWSDTVKVSVPRCGRCQIRNWIVAAVVVSGFLIGGLVGGTEFPSRGWTSVAGAFGTLAVLILLLRAYSGIANLRPVDSFPPIVQLKSEGWSEPD